MLDVLETKPYDVSTLRCVHYASAPMPVPLLRRALDRMGPIFVQVYGMTECLIGTILKSHDILSAARKASVVCVRRVSRCLGNEVKIVRDDGTACDTGEIGEILFRSPTIMSGYWNKPELTAEVIRDGWIHTQDLGFVDGSKFVYVVDRKRDMIISGGENIYSWEVEEALRAHPDVADVAVIAVPDEVWGESVKACVQMRPGRSATRSGADRLHAQQDRELQETTQHRFRAKPPASVQRKNRQEGFARAVLERPRPAGVLNTETPLAGVGPRSACSRPSCATLAWKPHER